jgi:hypothetical protein
VASDSMSSPDEPYRGKPYGLNTKSFVTPRVRSHPKWSNGNTRQRVHHSPRRCISS